jgi:polar amino acid transport system substrate-binding protein
VIQHVKQTKVPACNPMASSLRPTGPAVVTPGSYMAAIKKRGYLIAGISLSTYHFGYLNPLDNQIEGFDIDMVKAVAAAIFGTANGHLKFVSVTNDQRIPAIKSGEVDIVAHTMTITCARLLDVDFSTVYLDPPQRVLVQRNSTATNLGSFAFSNVPKDSVCATAGSTSLAPIRSAGVQAVAVANDTDCLVLLQEGKVGAISTDETILQGLKAQDPETKIIGPPLTGQPYGLAISQLHPDFVRFINAVLAKMRADGQWAASYRHWIGTPVPPPPPAHYRD